MLFKPPQSESAHAVFSAGHELQAMLQFEAALARAEARAGIVPAADSENIARFCKSELLDAEVLAAESSRSGNAAIPMVQQLTRLVREHAPGSEFYVHWGATSQDVLDTGLVLQLRDLFGVTEQAIRTLCATLARLCRQYAAAPAAGRTWLQHAVPIPFGMKFATALDAMLRHHARLGELKSRVLVLQFGGAAGTLTALGDHGEAVAAALAEELQLALPSIPWHTHRDRITEVACFYGMLAATLGKVARDLSLLMQTEFGEVAEAQAEGKGGSSTMPQKHNPVTVASVIAATLQVPGLVSTVLTAAASQEHERGLGNWQAEWSTLPQLCLLAQDALEATNSVLTDLTVDTVAMRANLEKSGGSIFAEAVSMKLAESVGKANAHEHLQRLTAQASATHIALRIVVERDELVRKTIGDALDSLFDPGSHMGSSAAMMRKVLAAYEARLGPPTKGGS